MSGNACSVGGDFETVSCPPYESPTLAYQCTNFDLANNVCLTYAWLEMPASGSSNQLDVHDPAVGQLIGSIAAFWALAFLYNFLFKFIWNK